MVRNAIILIFILLFSIIPVNAEITEGACTDVLIAVGATCTATGFRDQGSGNTNTVWKVVDVDASVTPRQALMQVAPYWLSPGNFRPVGGQVTQQGTYFRYTNPSDSNDFVEIFIQSVFQGGDFNGVQTGAANYQQTSYVNSNIGSDSNTGNTPSTAWASIGKATSTVQDGENVIVSSGSYTSFSGSTFFTLAGLSNAPVIFTTSGATKPIVINDASNPFAVMYMKDSTYNDWSGFDIRPNNGFVGIELCGTSTQGSTNNLIHDNNIISNGDYLFENSQCGVNIPYNTNNIFNNSLSGNFGIALINSGSTLENFFYNNTDLTTGTQVAAMKSFWQPYNGTIGNYWASYTGIDANGDQIGDTAFVADAVTDNFPKMDREKGFVKTELGVPVSGAVVFQNASNIFLPAGILVSASDNIKLSDDPQQTTLSTTPVLMKDIPITNNYYGSWRIKFDLASQDTTLQGGCLGTGLAQIYKNGAPYGTLQSKSGAGFQTFTQDFSPPGVVTGDDIQLYAYAGVSCPTRSPSTFVRNFRIDYDIISNTNATSTRNVTTDANGYYELSTIGRNQLTLNATASYGFNETSFTFNSVNANITLHPWGISHNEFDPSGFVLDTAGNPVFNAKVQLSNATFDATPSYSDSTGFWNTNIFADGTYDVVVSKAGFTTNTTSQAFTVGGTNNNFTLTPSQGLIFGRIFTTINSTGSTPVKADLDQIKSQLTAVIVSTGATITLLDSPDGHTYVIKLIDADSSTQTAVIQILKDGSVINNPNGDQLNLNQLFQFKIRETDFSTTFIEITLNNVFQGKETAIININAGFNNYKKPGTNLIQFLGDIVFGISGVLINPFNWDGFTTDGSNTLPVTYNASIGKDAIGSQVFDAGSAGNIFNFYAVLNAQSTSSNAGKVLLGYTDDNILTAPAFTDTLFINSRNIYRGTTEDFKSLDADGDGKIRVWFDFVSGYSSFSIYEFYVNMLGATTLKPLIGANVYFNVTVNTRSTSPNGNYTLFVPFGTDTINYYLTGYESKNITYTFNSTHENLQQDIILNATNRTFNSTEEYVFVLPNPSLTTDQLHAFFRTLDHTNPLLLGSGDYQIAVCPLINGGIDCTKYDVDANTESSISIANPGLGEYTISLTGFLGGFLDFERDIIVSNNFTVLSSTPSVKWDSPIHYLDEAMILTIYVPSGSAFVNVSYPNGTMLYSNSFSAATTLYNISFQTNSNLSINQFPPGTYKAVISGGNTDFTELKNISAGAYSVSAPSNVIQGDIFTISYQSPRTSTLYITDSNNDVLLSEDVPPQGGTTGTEQFDTATLENKDTILTIQLLRGGVSLANTTVTVTHSAGAGTPGSGGEAAQTMGDNLIKFMAMPAFWGVIFFILGVFAVSSNDRESKRNDTGLVAFILVNLLAVVGLWAPFTFYVLVIVWIIASMNFYIGRKMSHPE